MHLYMILKIISFIYELLRLLRMFFFMIHILLGAQMEYFSVCLDLIKSFFNRSLRIRFYFCKQFHPRNQFH